METKKIVDKKTYREKLAKRLNEELKVPNDWVITDSEPIISAKFKNNELGEKYLDHWYFSGYQIKFVCEREKEYRDEIKVLVSFELESPKINIKTQTKEKLSYASRFSWKDTNKMSTISLKELNGISFPVMQHYYSNKKITK